MIMTEPTAGPSAAADPEPVPPAPAEAVPPSIAEGVERSLDPRSVTVERIAGWILTGSIAFGGLIPLFIVLVAASLPGWAAAGSFLLWVAFNGALGWWLHRWPVIAYRHASYKVDGQGIEIRRGVVWRKVIHVPRSRVQHTDVSQGPIERRYGLGTLVIYTAGTDHARIDLGGLDHATALRIRDHLLPGEGGDAV